MNAFQDVFDKQKAYFETGVTRTYEWRIEQLDRMIRMIGENESRLQKAVAADFKTASWEYTFETASAIGEAEFHRRRWPIQAWFMTRLNWRGVPLPRSFSTM